MSSIEMLASETQTGIDEQAVEMIAARVSAALREDLEAMLQLTRPTSTTPSLTVEQLAALLRVARSTVYAHWREWGGYKLGSGKKAPIRFDQDKLSIARHATAQAGSDQTKGDRAPRTKTRKRHDLIADAPRISRTRQLHDDLV